MNKILLIVIIVMLAFGAEAALSVRLEDTAALLKANGSAIIEPGIFEDIVPLGENLFAAGGQRKYALMNSSGALLTEAVYSDLRVSGSAVLACRNGLWGLLDWDGKEISAFSYTRLVSDGTYFWALKGSLSDLDSDELFLLDGEGNETETGLMVRRLAQNAAGGRVAVQAPDSLAWGWCDGAGRMVIPAKYSHAGLFRSGLAVMVLDGKYGAVDIDGNTVLPARYDFLEISPSGMMLAGETGTGIHVFSVEGTEIAAYTGGETFAALVGDAYAVYSADRMRLYDAEANEILSASQYAAVYEGLNGQYILSDGSWGENCVLIAGTETAYQNIYPLGMAGEEPLYACMQVNAARYMNDLLDEIQLAMDMDNARYGVIDAGGEILLPAVYQSVQYVGDNRLLVRSGGLWELVDSSGNVYWSYGIRQSEEPSF